MEIIDLSNPTVLRQLVTSAGPDVTSFIAELTTHDDSDVELDLPEEETADQSRVLPVHRRRPDEEEEEEMEEERREEPVQDNTWREGASTPNRQPFSGESGLQAEVNENASPLDFLHLMITNEMMEEIVVETNRYAADSLRDKQLSPFSRFHKWVDVSVGEMWAFFGLIIAMGLIVIEDLDEYWSIDDIYNLPLFRSVIKRNRFSLILSFFHLCNNGEQLPKDHPNHDPLFKIRRFVTQLNDNFQRAFKPGDKIAIDEAMVAWRGHLSFRVYSPDKPDKFGIKVFELCDSATGYCSNLEFYTGKKEVSPNGATFDVVHRLIEPYLGCGRILYVDNYYSSHDLFTFLKDHDTYACGTLRLNRRNGPPKAMIPKLSRKETETKYLTNGSLNLLRFFDKREVNILTTAHDSRMIDTGRVCPVTKQNIIKLQAVDDYNKNMGAVDRSDQMVSYNAFKRRTLKWWKKAFFHMFMLGVLNAYLLHKATSVKKLSHRIFRRDLAKQLIQYMSVAISPRPSDVGDTSLLRLSARHFADLIKPKPGAKQKNPQRDCLVCSAPGKRKHTRYECRCCNVGLHVTPCFEIYHTRKDFKRAMKRKLQDEEHDGA